ncbi:hypothetical protein IHE45_19G155700 [Dioscorea alata]|uniref:Uncharacterized protein n=1 Tax=Dioscorea alata TaxID=55571 RepID=A0ACB7U2V8_DIOAL|nr:hypothetical protein IHE45_19G155700 [Dioscorea alata]
MCEVLHKHSMHLKSASKADLQTLDNLVIFTIKRVE